MISRDNAIVLLKKYPQRDADMNHYFESEAIMRALAEKFGEDVKYWGMLGLLHDVDWAITKNNPSEHLSKAPEILRDVGFDEEFIDAVLSHDWDTRFFCSEKTKRARRKLNTRLRRRKL